MVNYIDKFRAFSNMTREELEKEVNSKRKKDNIDKIVAVVFDEINDPNKQHNPVELLKLKANAQRLGMRIRGGKSFESDEDISMKNLYQRIQDIVTHGSALLTKLLKENPIDAIKWLSQFDNLESFKNNFATYEQRAVVFTILDSLDLKYIGAPKLKTRIEEWIGQCQKIPTERDIKKILTELNEIDVNNMLHIRDFNELLKFNGFKSHIKDIDFAKLGVLKEDWGVVEGTPKFKNVKFNDIVFENCKLSWANFKGSVFQECFFKDCNLSFSIWESAMLKNVTFENCHLERGLFNRSVITATFFIHCDLSHNNFNNSKLDRVTLQECILHGTSFLYAKVKECSIQNKEEDPTLENCLMYGNEADFNLVQVPKLSEPRIAITWNVEKPGPTGKKVETALIKAKSLPMKINYNPDEISVGSLLREVLHAFAKVDIKAKEDKAEEDKAKAEAIKAKKDFKAKDVISIPYSLIQVAQNNPKDYPIMKKILEMANKLTDNVECIVLPGGEHIEEYFYDMESLNIGDDYRRSILEFALLYYAREKGLPVMGICRGCQIIGLYYGIPLKDVPGQMGSIKSYTSSEESKTKSLGIIRSTMGKKTIGVSYHHQALDLKALEKNKTLEKVFESEGVPKAMEGTEGAPLLAFQFHPEIKSDPTELKDYVADLLLSATNFTIFQEFTKSGKTILQKRALLAALSKANGKLEEL